MMTGVGTVETPSRRAGGGSSRARSPFSPTAAASSLAQTQPRRVGVGGRHTGRGGGGALCVAAVLVLLGLAAVVVMRPSSLSSNVDRRPPTPARSTPNNLHLLVPSAPGAAPPPSALVASSSSSLLSPPYAGIAPGYHLMEAPTHFVEAFEQDASAGSQEHADTVGNGGGIGGALAAAVRPDCLSLARAVTEPMSAAYEPRWFEEELSDDEEKEEEGSSSKAAKGARRRQPVRRRKKKKKLPPPLELAGGVPRVAWRWESDDRPAASWTKRRFFESLPFDLHAALDPAKHAPQQAETDHPCPHCSYVLRYKTHGGRLFAERRRRQRTDLGAGGNESAAAFEEALLAGMHLYDVPDADFAVHLGDGAPGASDLLLIQQNVDRGRERAGIAAPFFAWRDALGPSAQLPALAACLDARYPRDFGANEGAAEAARLAGGGLGEAKGATGGAGGGSWLSFGRGTRNTRTARIPRAFWRGSSTDPRIATVDEANLLDVRRARLALAGRWFPGLLDSAFVAHPQQAFSVATSEHGGGNAAEILLPLGEKVAPLERANRWAVVLDADGNGWSDRYRHLALYPTPVLKQASNRTAFFEHVVGVPVGLGVGGGGEGRESGGEGDGNTTTLTGLVDTFAPDAFDLPVRAREMLAQLGTEQGSLELRRRVARRRAAAAALLSQPAVAEAAAAAVALAARLSGWAVDAPRVKVGGGGRDELVYDEVPRSRCCSLAAVPREFAEAVRRGGGVEEVEG